MAKNKYFSWSPIKQLMKKSNPPMIAKEAVNCMIGYLETYTEQITEQALEFMRHSNRKKLSAADIRLAVEQ